jgi:hypothetical protein
MEQLRLFKDAAKYFSKIDEVVRLERPVLLPGIRSECLEENLIRDDSSLADPQVQALPIPHRYTMEALAGLANVHLTLAEQYSSDSSLHINEARLLLEQAKQISVHAIKLFGCDSPHVTINLELSEIMVDTYSIMRLHSGKNKKKVIDRLYDMLSKIDKQVMRLPLAKTLEWNASCWAALSFLNNSYQDHTESLHNLHKYVERLIRLVPGSTDWLTVDPIYFLAHTTPDDQVQYQELIKVARSCIVS